MAPKGYEGEIKPATLGSTAKAHLWLLVWCKSCRHEIRLDPAGQAERYGADLPLRPRLGQPARLPLRQPRGRFHVVWRKPDG